MSASSKTTLRREMMERRRALPPEEHREHSLAACSQLAALLQDTLPPPRIVASYIPIRGELDTMYVNHTLHQAGYKLALPHTPKDMTLPLYFFSWKPEDMLAKDTRNLDAPPYTSDYASPDVMLVPLLAFNTQGYRLGYGGGYYDRTLAALRAQKRILAIGLAFEMQRLDKLPVEAHDERLDTLITEKDIYSYL